MSHETSSSVSTSASPMEIGAVSDHAVSGKTEQSLSLHTIDSLEFARTGRLLKGVVKLAQLSRLADQLLDINGSLSMKLQGKHEAGRSLLHMQITGQLVVQCQRCLAGVSLPVQVDNVLQLIGAGEDWPDEELMDDQMDAIEADAALNVSDLIESEVLLALPPAPRHEDCELPLAAVNNHGSVAFSALAALKKH